MADPIAIEWLVKEVSKRLSPPTILVNNAGVIEPLGALHEAELEAFAANITVNLVGAAVGRAGGAAGHGRRRPWTIVNISSGAARIRICRLGRLLRRQGGPGDARQVLAAEYGDKGIRVFGFAPGIVDTDMQSDDPRRRHRADRVPAAREVSPSPRAGRRRGVPLLPRQRPLRREGGRHPLTRFPRRRRA